MRLLTLDIETSPYVSYHWEPWQQNIFASHVIKPKFVMCFAAKWYGESGMMFSAGDYHPNAGLTDRTMAQDAYDLLDEADGVIHFNGRKFDIPNLNRLIVGKLGRKPSPFRQIDLRTVAKREFAFPYNSLDYICRELGIGTKLKGHGFELWPQCMAGEPQAWGRMQRYNERDVRITERLYTHWRPWIASHPSYAPYSDGLTCVRCNSTKLIKQGYSRTQISTFQKYQCKRCGAWSRGAKRLPGGSETREAR